MTDIIELLKSASNHQLMSIDDLDLTLAAVNVPAINELMSRMSEGEVAEAAGYNVANGEATITVRGLLVPSTAYDLSAYGVTSYNIVSKYIAEAKSDDNVTSVKYDVDSSGGFVKGLDKVIADMEALGKPSVTVATGTMASAALWLGVTADRVVAIDDNIQVGSIGVFTTHTDVSKALANQGIEKTVFKSGEWKGAFASHTPLTAREKTRMQAKVDEAAGTFFDHVAANRSKLTREDVKALEGDTFNAKKALNNGLIDAISANNENANDLIKGQQATMTTLSQAEHDAQVATAVENARKELKAEMEADALKAKARTALIVGHDNSTDEVVALLDSPAFAAVSDEDLSKLLALMPASSVEAALNAQGGANVEPAPAQVDTTPVNGAEADAAKAKANDDAALAMSKIDATRFL